MGGSPSLPQAYNSQQKVAFEEEKPLPAIMDRTSLTNTYWFSASIILGALVAGIILGPIVVLYTKQNGQYFHAIF
ncbi:unnamed protein product [Adineta steineri]|uniref:Uncharacterized protein n=1 Tax=Adineta steineri TaxID=433720 RepID=A0A814QRH5_9BILA|nr:unnamed protein product [Adineta steineri]